MNGQWIGKYSSVNSGSIICQYRRYGRPLWRCRFSRRRCEPQVPAIAAFIRTIDKSKRFKIKATIGAINPQTLAIDTWNNVKHFFPTITAFPQEAEVQGHWTDKQLFLKWTIDIGSSGSITLDKTRAGDPSELTAKLEHWDGFKEVVSKLEKRRFLFRGQDVRARLRTKFHRTKRADLGRLLSEDIQTLHKHLSIRTRHIYNLAIPDQNGAFFDLVQHHGYPTPLLDWTYSPYVAAFFAYRAIANSEAEKSGVRGKNVRIYIFDQKQWHQDFSANCTLKPADPEFLNFGIYGNGQRTNDSAASRIQSLQYRRY